MKQERYDARAAQLERFCGKYGLDKSQAVIGGGHRKDIIMFPEEVYVLPFSEESAAFVEREHAFFRCYHGKMGIEIPRFIRSFRDQEFCPYEIGVLSRIQGDLLCNVIDDMDWPKVREVFLSVAGAAPGWHNVGPDEELYKRHGASFADLSPLPIMNRWLSWVLKPQIAMETLEWLHALLLAAAKGEGLDTSFLTRTGTKEAWCRAISELAALKPVILHGDLHDGQLILRPGSTVVTGVIDWDNFCLGNPVMDFSMAKWFPWKMWFFRKDFHDVRIEMWQRYLDARGLKDFWKGGLNLFLVMTEVVRVICEKEKPKIWLTKGPYREALQEYVQHLERASTGIAE